ncbi:MAG TPA: glycosyltransferase family 1 protein [Verrucomicrobiae bacterium]|jgi:glycosyltransferase involved in cell wall biosynthesis|nr:glycosyltransferase family 1 protein [Verrucomicrobiae bacterium]
MSKIVIDAREWSTSTGRYISSLVRYLEQIDQQQHDYCVLLKPGDMNAWEPNNPRFRKVACPYKEFSFGEQLGFKRQLDGLRPDLVHFGMVQQPVRYRGKTVTTMNDLTTTRFRNPAKNRLVFACKQVAYRWVNHRVARKTNAIITYSQFVKDDVVRFTEVSPAKITVIPLAAEPITAAAEPIQRLVGKQFVLYVGRPMPHKNLERLGEAFQLLRSQHPDLILALAGKKDANYQRLERHFQKHGFTNIVFTDFVGEGQLRWLYEHCAAYAFPSLSEGFGLPGLEAMLHGAPVVSSNATCLPEVYGEAAHYFDPLDRQAMADALNEVLTDKALRQKLVATGKQQAAKYSWQLTAKQTLEIYNKTLGG